jgi:amino acid adenylation domain-containing protein
VALREQSVTIHGLFERQVALAPDRVAVISEAGSVTYRELDTRAEQIAERLTSRGAGPARRVAIILERSPDLPAAILGTLKTGSACVCLDPTDPRARLSAILADADVSVVVTAEAAPVDLIGRFAQLPLGAQVPPPTEATATLHERPIDRHAPAFLFYTTGSTGRPKGVAISHGARLNRLRWEVKAYEFNQDDTMLVKSSASFARIVKELFWPLVSGGRAVLAEPGMQLDLGYVSQLVHRRRVSVAIMVPSQIAVLADTADPGLWNSVRFLLAEGEPLTADVYNRFITRFAVDLYNAYGLTEVSTVAVWKPPRRRPITCVPIGRPAGLELLVVDERLAPVPDGTSGELLVCGAGIADGYHRQPELTAERFLPDLRENKPWARMFRTGDRVRRLDDGSLEHLGRIDSQVKIRGFQIEPHEVEQVLERHPAVANAVVIARPVRDQQQLVAYVVCPEWSAEFPTRLREFAAGWLPKHMIPARFVPLATVPLTPNGKVAWQALPDPDDFRPLPAHTYEPPRNEAETILANLWEELLDVHPIGVDDDFFALGGDSLAAAVMFAELPHLFGVTLPLGDLIHASTIAELAGKLHSQPAAVPPELLVPLSTDGSLPPLFLIHGLYGNVLCFRELAQTLAPDQAVYALQAVGLTGHEPPCDRVEGLAERYLDEIIKCCPQGPVILGGYSFGGMVAWEIASRLQTSGREVTLVALIEAVPAALHVAVAPFLYSTSIRVQHSSEHFKERRLALDFFVSSESESLNPSAWALRPVSADRQFAAVAQAALVATRRYVAPRLQARVVLFRGDHPSPLEYEPRYGWGSLVDGPYAVHDVPGDHVTILSPPGVTQLGVALRSEIGEALRQVHT